VSHFCGLAIYIKKVFLRQKEELWKFKYFIMQRYKSSKKTKKKKTSKRNQNPSSSSELYNY
jgi:hypothetical protein